MDRGAAVFLCGLHSLFQAGAHTRSRLQSSEALLYAVAGQIREDIMLLDLRGRVEDMNIHVQTRTGAARHELIGKPCWNVQTLTQGTPFCRGPNRKCPFHTTLTTRAKAEALLTRVDPEGNLMYFRVYSYPIFGESGDMEHVMIMRRDITSRTRRERQLSQSEKLAVIGEMSMYLAHEIKNPLFAIGGFVHALMRSEAIVGKDREKLEIIQEECLRLDRILGSILSFARPSKDPSESVDLAAVVSQVAELMRIGYGKQNYEFDTRSDYPLPKVQGGADRIKQCLINILKNSMEAMPGGGKIVISTGTSGDMVALIVEDTGRGMSQSEMERAFSPFYTTKDQGSGLGLAMIKKIIEEFGGRVELHSREGHGTTVTLLFMPYLAERWAPGEALPANADAETMTPGPDIAPHRDHGADAKQ
nr:ATP-binding protein [Desulfobaculum xiamenense]